MAEKSENEFAKPANFATVMPVQHNMDTGVFWIAIFSFLVIASCDDKEKPVITATEPAKAGHQRATKRSSDPLVPNRDYAALSEKIRGKRLDRDLISDIKALAIQDLPAALSLMEQLAKADSFFFEVAVGGILIHFIESGQAEEAADWLAKNPRLHNCGQLDGLYDWLAKNRSELAVQWCERFTGRARMRTRLIALSHMCRTGNATEALDYLNRIEGKDLAICCAQIVVCCQQSQDYENVLAAWRKIPGDYPRKDDLLNQSIHSWLKSDYSGALKAIEQFGSSELKCLLTCDPVLFTILSNNGGDVLLTQVGKMPLSKEFLPVFEKVSWVLGNADVKLGMDVLQTIPTSEGRDNLVKALYAKAALLPKWDANNLPEISSARDRMSALRGVASALAEVDYDKAIGCAADLAPDQQREILREVATTLAKTDSKNAVRMIEDTTFPEKIGTDFRQEMLNATVTTWAKRDLSAAQQWVEKLPETDAAKGYQGLMTTWMKTDPVAASAWLSTQPLGPGRDAGAQVLISQIKDTDPEMAEQWRKTLPPETTK